MTSPVLAALAQARIRAAPLFARWCMLNGLSHCPATPAAVAKFITDCASLGIERLWPAVQEISATHESLGFADPTFGGVAAVAIHQVTGIQPPRSWPADRKKRFLALPYDLQVDVAEHEARRERALRRAQNDAAHARQDLAKLQQSKHSNIKGSSHHDLKANEADSGPGA